MRTALAKGLPRPLAIRRHAAPVVARRGGVLHRRRDPDRSSSTSCSSSSSSRCPASSGTPGARSARRRASSRTGSRRRSTTRRCRRSALWAAVLIVARGDPRGPGDHGAGPARARGGTRLIRRRLGAAMTGWSVSGTYLEACNCDAICPCRRVGGVSGGRSTTGECIGALSWVVESGSADGVDLARARRDHRACATTTTSPDRRGVGAVPRRPRLPGAARRAGGDLHRARRRFGARALPVGVEGEPPAGREARCRSRSTTAPPAPGSGPPRR